MRTLVVPAHHDLIAALRPQQDSAAASLLLATAQPSLLESTMTGFPFSSGRKTLSHEAKKLLQSARAYLDNYAEAYGEAMGCGAG